MLGMQLNCESSFPLAPKGPREKFFGCSLKICKNLEKFIPFNEQLYSKNMYLKNNDLCKSF